MSLLSQAWGWLHPQAGNRRLWHFEPASLLGPLSLRQGHFPRSLSSLAGRPLSHRPDVGHMLLTEPVPGKGEELPLDQPGPLWGLGVEVVSPEA